VVDLARRARDQGAIVLFDPNLRPAQWESPAAAAETHREVLPYTDWYLCGEQEGCQLFGAPNAVGVLEAARAGGARAAIVRVGTRGAVIDGDDGPLEIPPVELAQVVDEVGAGDAFAAGFAYGLLEGWSVPESARSANILAAAALAGTGDWETLPYLAELERRLRAAGGLPQG
jgi:sugar/nucleoside kinase (ribokinase family)